MLIQVKITCRPVLGSEQGNTDNDDDYDDDCDSADDDDDGNVYDDDDDGDELAGLCGAQSGAGDKKILDATLRKANSKSDVTLTKTSNGSKVELPVKSFARHSMSLKVKSFDLKQLAGAFTKAQSNCPCCQNIEYKQY